MSNFRLVASGIDVAAVNRELDEQPALWNSWTYRTQHPDSPHYEVSDIWLRFRDREEAVTHKSYVDPHYPVFWPAWAALPSLHPIVRNLSHVVNSVHLGGILITKTAPGKQVKRHVDRSWHAEWFDTKLYVVLKSNPHCLNSCGDDVENFRAGDCWEYPNSIPHGVDNRGDTDHINVIICYRTTAHEMAEASR